MKTISLLLVATMATAVLHAQDKVDFVKQIQPILDKQCTKCHGAEKQKGKLRLDSRAAALKGGSGGPALVPGDAAKSDLVRRISLPKDDDDFMPSEGEPLAKEQIDRIREWIDQGAVWPETAATAPPKTKPDENPLPTDFKPGANEAKAVAALRQRGVEVRPLAANVPWTQANFRLQGTNITDAALAPVKDLLSLTDLNLATTRVTDAGLASIAGLRHLTRLHLELTSIGDAGLAHLKGLDRLQYLNLYGTQVTDAGLERLKGLKSLRRLYLWQSKATEAGAARLREALPDLEISTGKELLEAVAKKEEKPEEKKEEKK